MTVRAIRVTGDPVLHAPTAQVAAFDAELRALVDDMFETMDAAPGVGLAAPQIGVGLAVFVYGWTDETGIEHRGAAVNPRLWITPPPVGNPDEDDDSEGCLSIPGERLPLLRAESAVLSAFDTEGTRFRVSADGWLARIFQHEFDHLNGILYADRLDHAHRRTIDKVVRRNGWGRPGISWEPGVDDIDP